MLSHVTKLSRQVDNQVELAFQSQSLDRVGNNRSDGLKVNSFFFLEPIIFGGIGIQLGHVVHRIENIN